MEWSTLDGATDARLALHVAQVVCLTCDGTYFEAADTCPGPAPHPARHRWVSLMTLAMTSDDAWRWGNPDAVEGYDARPRSTNLLCSLCGQLYEQADETCPERAFWQLAEQE